MVTLSNCISQCYLPGQVEGDQLWYSRTQSLKDFVGQAVAGENRSRLRIRESRRLTEVSGKKIE